MVTAEHLVDASPNNQAFANAIAKKGSFPVRASERSAYVIDGLDAGEAYDVFFVVEVGGVMDILFDDWDDTVGQELHRSTTTTVGGFMISSTRCKHQQRKLLCDVASRGHRSLWFMDEAELSLTLRKSNGVERKENDHQ